MKLRDADLKLRDHTVARVAQGHAESGVRAGIHLRVLGDWLWRFICPPTATHTPFERGFVKNPMIDAILILIILMLIPLVIASEQSNPERSAPKVKVSCCTRKRRSRICLPRWRKLRGAPGL